MEGGNVVDSLERRRILQSHDHRNPTAVVGAIEIFDRVHELEHVGVSAREALLGGEEFERAGSRPDADRVVNDVDARAARKSAISCADSGRLWPAGLKSSLGTASMSMTSARSIRATARAEYFRSLVLASA